MKKYITILILFALLFEAACTEKRADSKIDENGTIATNNDKKKEVEADIPAPGGVVPVTDIGDEVWWDITLEDDFKIGRDGTITAYNGQNASVFIPPRILGVAVTAIGDSVFKGRLLTSVTLPAGLTYIGSEAFRNCDLKNVTIPDGVTYIGDRAFESNQLTSVNIPAGVSVGHEAFSFNNSLAEFVLGADIHFETNIRSFFAYYEYLCNDRKAGVYNERYTSRKEGDFEFIPTRNGVIITGYSGREDRLEIPRLGGMPVKGIFHEAFAGKGISSVQLPGSLIFIGFNAFQDNQLTSVTIPDSVVLIEDYAFLRNQLTEITIGNDVRVTKDHFSLTYGFDDIYKANRRRAGTYLSGDGRWVLAVPNFVTEESDFTTDGQGTITKYTGRDRWVVIPNRISGVPVRAVGTGALYEKQLVFVTMPDSVIIIGEYALAGNQLTGVTIPDGVTVIGDTAFTGNRLTSVTISGNVTAINKEAFAYNQLAAVTIPDSVTSIGDGAFQHNKLASVAISANVTSIGNNAFRNNNLTAVVIPENVTSIGNDAFHDNNLTAVVIPENVTSIGNHAFFANKLSSVTMPDNITKIGIGAFGYNQLTNVIIPDRFTLINGYAFVHNQLQSVNIPAGVTAILDFAFAENQLQSVIIPDSVTFIGWGAFCGNRLTVITIGANVGLGHQFRTVINPEAFDNGFDDFYNANGKQAGTYVLNNGQWGMR